MAIKQVLILRTDLNRDAQSVDPRPASPMAAHLPSFFGQCEWVLDRNQERIFVGVPDEATLLEKFSEASELGIRCTLIKDMGKTRSGQLETCTVLILGPADTALVDALTGELPLLGVGEGVSV